MSNITLEAPAAESPPAPKSKSIPYQVLEAMASLRLTVVLFVLSFLLVLFGTLAQIDLGIWTVIRAYFRDFVVWVPFNLFNQFGQIFLGLPREWSPGVPVRVPGSFPFPAGWTLAFLLLVNLVAAHVVRFKLTMRRSGILVLHAGLIVMLIGEVITGVYAVEGNMIINEGQTVNTVSENRRNELVVIDRSGEKTREVSIPSELLRQKGTKISHDDLPFDVEPVRYMVNADIVRAGKDNPGDSGIARFDAAAERAEVSGVATKQTVDLPACYVKLIDRKTGEPIGTYVFSILLEEQVVTVNGKPYEMALRFRQTYRPFSLTLIKFRFDKHPGTNTPKNFSSEVRLVDPQTGDDRVQVIRMNEPLRHRGETFYQADWNKQTERGTVLQVVRNPAWQLPYWSCAIVTLGLLIHFGFVLTDFLNKRGV